MIDGKHFNKALKQQLIYHCLIRRYSEKQIQDYIKAKTGKKIAERSILNLKSGLKEDARKYFFMLTKDNNEAYVELKTKIDSTKEIVKKLWDDFERAGSIPNEAKEEKEGYNYNYFARARIADQILREEKQIQEWYQLLNYEHGNGYNTSLFDLEDTDKDKYSYTF